MRTCAAQARAVVLLALLVGASSVALAQQSGPDFEVNSNLDPGDGICDATGTGDGCTLREALAAANADVDISTITFAPVLAGQPIRLTGVGDTTFGPSALVASTQVTIRGLSGNSGIAIARRATVAKLRLFHVTVTGNLTLERLTLGNGTAIGGNGGGPPSEGGGGGAAGLGGAILNEGTLNVIESTLSGNTALGGNGGAGSGSGSGGGGGGLNGDGGFPTAGAGGGGPGGAGRCGAGGPGAFGGGGGGGTYSMGGGGGGAGGFGGGGGGASGLPCPSQVGGPAGFGGGVGANGGGTGGGSGGGGGAGLGGAIFNHGGTIAITNSTLSGNTAQGGSGGNATGISGNGGSGGSGFGGGLFNLNGTVTVTNSTVASNGALAGAGGTKAPSGTTNGVAGTAAGGGVYNLAHEAVTGVVAANATLTLRNTIVAVSTTVSALANHQRAQVATVHATDPNIVWPSIANTGGTVNGGGILNVNPLLDPLAPNGGPTATHALQGGSPAVDAGDSSGSTTDQRGIQRPIDNASVANAHDGADIGAFEADATQVGTTLTVNNAGDTNDGACTFVHCTLREAINAANSLSGANTIDFDIPGTGPHVIELTSALPPINGPVTIDGYTEDGATENTNDCDLGSNAVLQIEVDGNNLGINGLVVSVGPSTIRGLALHGFATAILLPSGGNTIEGNFVGTDAAGTAGLGNSVCGVRIVQASANVIGGTTDAARNIVSGTRNRGPGIQIDLGGSTGNLVQCNLIGTAKNGVDLIANTGPGVYISQGASRNTVGGTTNDTRNVISGNQTGVLIEGPVNTVQGNTIGLDVSGTLDKGNILDGVFSNAYAGNTIGGAGGGGNILSGNDRFGVTVANGSTGTQVLNNFIGTDKDGLAAVGNTLEGVIVDGRTDTTVAGNLISGNVGAGVSIRGDAPTLTVPNKVQGNFIGTQADGTSALGNGSHGVQLIFVGGSPRDHLIGGTGAGEGNLIAFNGGDGVFLDALAGPGNAILSNSIHSNAGLGIDLGTNGVNTPNDPQDPDPGPNNLQNFPVLTAAFTPTVGQTTILGTLDTNPSQTIRIEFFSSLVCDGDQTGAPSGTHGEGQEFLGSVVATDPDNDGFYVFSFNPASPVPVGEIATATATNDTTKDTSEFSACRQVEADTDSDGDPDSTDCNDADPAINQFATEVCNDADDDCDGATDEGLPTTTFYRDADTDGFGDPNDPTQDCSQPAGYVADNTDCNDANGNVHPGATEVCNGTDDNCDDLTDNGAICDDGNACTVGDRCVAGVCTNFRPVVCTAQDQCHDVGVCDRTTGVCSNPPKADGSLCDDGDACVTGESCQAGACTGGTQKICTAQNQCHDVGVCDPQTGFCSNPAKDDDTPCTDGDACTTGESCQAGACTGGAQTVCRALDQCHDAGVCDPATGVCSNPPKANDTPCNDGNACTTGESCQAGTCTGGAQTVCRAQDQCHDVGVCDPTTGVCSNPAKADGASCIDGNACTTGDSCQRGACTGAAVVCTPLDQCHDAGVCDPATGACSNPRKQDGTTCNDGNACTTGDSCQAGLCAGTQRVCIAQDQCHDAGVCNPSTGICSNPPKTNGAPCEDGNQCTAGDSCQAGACRSGGPRVCTAQDSCHSAGTCSPATGCSNPIKPNGSTCNDGNACTRTDTCQSGTCTGKNPVVCTAKDACHVAGTCTPATGLCSNPAKPDGTSCNDSKVCTRSDSCQAGVCTGTAVVCTPLDSCHTAGTCNTYSGVCSNPVKPNGATCSDGNPCTQTDTCQSGTCRGNQVICTPQDACHYAGSCNPATGVCSNPVKPDGSSCSDGDSCTCNESCHAGSCSGGSAPRCPVGVVEGDATVKQASPSTKFGGAVDLEARSGTASQTLLRLRVSGTSGIPITSALLRLTVKNASSTSGGRIHPVSCGWSEGTVTWTYKPALGAVLDSEGPTVQGQVVEFDVRSVIQGDGVYCFAIDNLNGNVLYHSREATSDKPQFAVGTSCACTP